MTFSTHTHNIGSTQNGDKRHGFTLMEIMLVISLLTIIMGTVMVQIGNIFGDTAPGLVEIAVTTTIPTALLSHRNREGSFPKSLADLSKKLKPDPWGKDYQYKIPGTHNPGSYDLWSMGADCVNGTADDIGNWDS